MLLPEPLAPFDRRDLACMQVELQARKGPGRPVELDQVPHLDAIEVEHHDTPSLMGTA